MHIVFDFDGTLADSQGEIQAQVQALFEKYGYPVDFEISVESLYQLRWDKKAKLLFFLLRKKDELTRNLRQSIARISFFPGIPDCLEQLRSLGHHISVITSNSAQNVRDFLSLQDNEKFLEIIGVKGIQSKKQSLHNYRKNYFLTNQEMAYITDDFRDVIACKELGIRVIAVSWGLTTRERLASAQPDALIDHANEIYPTLKKLCLDHEAAPLYR